MAKDDVKKFTAVRQLKFTLTKEELAAKAKDAGRLARELGEMNSSFEEIKKSWKGKIALKEGELRSVERICDDGFEQRTVEVMEEHDYNAHLVRYVYRGEVMEERAMEPHERQLDLVPTTRRSRFAPAEGEAAAE